MRFIVPCLLAVAACVPETPSELEAAVPGGLGRVDLAISEGDPVPAQTITVTNNGSGTLAVTITNSESSGGNWIMTSPGSLTVPKGQSRTFTVTFPEAATDLLYAGTYTGTVRLDGITQPSGTPSSPPTILIPVNLSVRRVVAGLATDTPAIDIDSPIPTLWRLTTTYGAPEPRHLPTLAWTSLEVLVTGGVDVSGTPVDTSWLYDPIGDLWRAATDLEGVYVHGSAVYDDGLVYLFGGTHGGATTSDTLTVWEPVLDTTLATYHHGPGRYSHASTVSNGKVWVWGGMVYDGVTTHLSDTGFSFDVVTAQFADMATVGAPSPRPGATLVSVPGALLVWGGGCHADGARYDLAGDSWTPMALAPAGASGPGVWSGKELIVWGSCDPSAPSAAGAAYDPALDRWRSLPTASAPSARGEHTIVWSGAEAIVFGGLCEGGTTRCSDGGAYDPVANAWRLIIGDEPAAPGARTHHGAVWTGAEMVVWGGIGASGAALATGAVLHD